MYYWSLQSVLERDPYTVPQSWLRCENVIKLLYALAEFSKDLPEPHPADRMEAAIATEASVCVFKVGIGALERWQFGPTLFGVPYNCFVEDVAATTPMRQIAD